ncbi:MAG TPA: hypothetical protein PK331_05325 [Gordonia sp. (in: high G+C Gram-positive bacteria)]|uniref:hypothetical protein n=2 Tax=unclassified Gordonia (in: high G+C Gram-positive bacteria) TaxID=2657482 RepID=UPI0026127344|nr:hypothetical protein [Gordonia sp. (in: high G+C Gram-positive bacteria)]HNP56660.1 hypothetical protein [Gordonia sp. (in: high G+C Gram-positive bacteria)]HRC50330.1 hypothetical protein [Gordonia sp. (in: high G+C Gram-positive bacteria)]
MSMGLDEQFGDLLDTLEPGTRAQLLGSIGSALHEGWEPTRTEMELRVAAARGDITDDEFISRSFELAQRGQ